MQVMTNHEWFDDDVEMVLMNGHADNREIVFKPTFENAFVMNKRDVIALAKEFGLTVYEADAAL